MKSKYYLILDDYKGWGIVKVIDLKLFKDYYDFNEAIEISLQQYHKLQKRLKNER